MLRVVQVSTVLRGVGVECGVGVSVDCAVACSGRLYYVVSISVCGDTVGLVGGASAGNEWAVCHTAELPSDLVVSPHL